MKKSMIWAEMARRYRRFHEGEDWREIRLWGLFPWDAVSTLIKSGELLTDMHRENKIVWVWPSEEAYHAHIEPLLSKSVEELDAMCGWG